MARLEQKGERESTLANGWCTVALTLHAAAFTFARVRSKCFNFWKVRAVYGWGTIFSIVVPKGGKRRSKFISLWREIQMSFTCKFVLVLSQKNEGGK